MSPVVTLRTKACRDGDHADCRGQLVGLMHGDPCGCACHDGGMP